MHLRLFFPDENKVHQSFASITSRLPERQCDICAAWTSGPFLSLKKKNSIYLWKGGLAGWLYHLKWQTIWNHELITDNFHWCSFVLMVSNFPRLSLDSYYSLEENALLWHGGCGSWRKRRLPRATKGVIAGGGLETVRQRARLFRQSIIRHLFIFVGEFSSLMILWHISEKWKWFALTLVVG